MQLGCDPLIGEHDYSSFCRKPKTAADQQAPSMTRRVMQATWATMDSEFGQLRFDVVVADRAAVGGDVDDRAAAIGPEMTADGTRHREGRSDVHLELLRRVPVCPQKLCVEVDSLFRGDQSLRGVLVEDDGVVRILDRDNFYQLLAGGLGPERLVDANMPLSALVASVRPAVAVSAAVSAAEVALSVIAAGDRGSRDLLVALENGGYGTLPVWVALAELSEVYRAQLEASEASERRFRAEVIATT